MAEKNWASKAWEKIDEGSLTKLGWPNADKLVAAARKDRAKVVRKLNFLANASSDPATRAKAKMIIKRIQKELGES